MDPLWRKYPEIPALSIGWRMGLGQEYYWDFYRWFSGLPDAEKTAYAKANPPPAEWRHLYKMIIEDPWNPARDGPEKSWSPKDSEGWDRWE